MREKVEVKKNSLVPEHFLLSKEELQELLQLYNITLSQLPKISHKDAAIKELGARAGDGIRIIRNSETGKKIAYFRLVVGDE